MTCPQICSRGIGGGKWGLRGQAPECSSNIPMEVWNLEHFAFFNEPVGPRVPGSGVQFYFHWDHCQRNRPCSFITYFKNLFCYLQVSQVVSRLLWSRWGLGEQDSWWVTFLSWTLTILNSSTEPKAPTRKKAQGQPYLSLMFTSLFLLFHRKQVTSLLGPTTLLRSWKAMQRTRTLWALKPGSAIITMALRSLWDHKLLNSLSTQCPYP